MQITPATTALVLLRGGQKPLAMLPVEPRPVPKPA